MFKNILKNTFIYDLIVWYRHKREFHHWTRNGKNIPVPHLIKQGTLREYSRRFNLNILVETGTYMGFTVLAMKNEFERIISIELSNELYERARLKFSRYPRIEVMKGDSSRVIPIILQKINEPALFWLDGHYSGEGTARGDLETPVVREIEAILNHKIKDHVILIDDAHCLNGLSDYPTLNKLRHLIYKADPGLVFEVAHDIVRIYRNTLSDKDDVSEKNMVLN
ncbi:hypothetical protein HY041_02130 [Candidatus Roizmanbacteria bacterium]|nr:hypothetical protein [Candidatus Roizmanbacteria bacterium]